MECKRYSNWIKNAALGSLDAVRAAELHRHLLKCSRCAQQLEREQRLLAAVDQAMVRSLAVEAADDLHIRIRQKIAGQTKASVSFPLGRIAAAVAACAVAVAIIFVWLPRHPIARRQTMNAALARRAKRRSTTVILSEAKNLKMRGLRDSASPPAPQNGKSSGLSRKHGRRVHRDSMPEVLVPKNEMALVLSLYNGVRTGKIDGASLLKTPSGFKREPDGTLTAAPLKIEPIKISEIKPVGIPTELQ